MREIIIKLYLFEELHWKGMIKAVEDFKVIAPKWTIDEITNKFDSEEWEFLEDGEKWML